LSGARPIRFYDRFQADGDLTVVAELPDDISFVIDVAEKVKQQRNCRASE
jgi:hypothetical protein